MRKLILLAMLAVPAVSQAWWNNDWNYRKEVSFDLSAQAANISATPVDVPVLIRLHAGNFGYFKDTKPDGSDLRFIAGDDKTPLAFHIERYDAINQLAYLWVRMPRLSGGLNTDKIYMYYGNSKATSAADAAGTYDANQALVLHYAEASGPPKDSSANNNAVGGSTADLNPASLIGGGARFTGNSFIKLPPSASLRLLPQRGVQFSSWVRIEAAQNDAYVLALEDQNGAIVLGISGSNAVARVLRGSAVAAEAKSSTELALGQWHHLALDITAGRLTLYVDGAAAANTPVVTEETAGTLTIGASAAGGHSLVGDLDETQVSDAGRPAEWVQAAARSQGMEGNLVQYGTDAQRESEKVSYFAVTMKNVTADGWVVIIILGLMFVMAMMVMVGKAIYLARIGGANKVFLREFEKLRGDPTQLDRGDDGEGDAVLDRSAFMPPLTAPPGNDFAMSTLYRLYHHGVQEIQKRTVLRSAGAAANLSAAPPALSSQATDAIRATLDAAQVRLAQKLQSQMVLLTIAISGGPFLGLLGTVVGVMITFAAIAASGDVNVNAIAPGIAAALVATVAGLGVAIPALFGYNWLNTRIKEINADMRVFVDEFVTRAAEHHS